MFIYYSDKIWEVLEIFDSMPEMDAQTKQEVSERIDEIIEDLLTEAWEDGHYAGEDLH